MKYMWAGWKTHTRSLYYVKLIPGLIQFIVAKNGSVYYYKFKAGQGFAELKFLDQINFFWLTIKLNIIWEHHPRC